MESTGVVQQLLTQCDQLTHHFVFNAYAALVSALAAPLALAITLSIALLGLSISQGWIKPEIGMFTKYGLRIGFVYAFAASWTVFSHYVYSGLTNGPGEITTVLISTLHVPFHGSNVNDALQNALNMVNDISDGLWGLGGIKPRLFSILAFALGLIMCGIALAEIIIAKISLAILLALAPLIIPMHLFESTRRIFDKWMGASVGFALLPIFVIAALVFILSFAYSSMVTVHTAIKAGGNVTGSMLLPFFLVAFIGCCMLGGIAGLAKSIGGEVSSSGSGAISSGIGAAIGAYAGAKTAMRSGNKARKKIHAGYRKVKSWLNHK